MKDKNDFFEKNETQVSRLMCRILFWMTLIFPVFFLMSALHIFSITIPELLRITPIGVACTISPAIMMKWGVSTKFIKNYSILAIALVIMLMAANAHVGIYITYVLALALSCLYFDKKFTIKTAVVGYLCMVAAVWFRSGGADLGERTRVSWFIAYTMGYTMEYAAMSAVFISLAGRARQLLETLYNTEAVREILKQCEDASMQLSGLLSGLNTAIRSSADNNRGIELEADKTLKGCEDTLEQVRLTVSSISDMRELAGESRQAAQSITVQIDEMEEHVVQTLEAVKENNRNVLEGIRELDEAKEEAGNLLLMQSRTDEAVKAVEKNMDSNAGHQERQRGMAAEMEDVAKSSIGQVEAIRKSIDRQKRLAGEMESAFCHVEEISKRLLETSRRQDLTS